MSQNEENNMVACKKKIEYLNRKIIVVRCLVELTCYQDGNQIL